MTSRKRNSPGIELNEIDHSQYDRIQNSSIVNTTTLVCGFGDKGENYTTKWINSIQTFEDEYGTPTNEVERYFYNAAYEVLSRGSMLLASKLPYDNDSLDKFAYADFQVSAHPNRDIGSLPASLKRIRELDDTISTYFEVSDIPYVPSNTPLPYGLIDIETFDALKTGNTASLGGINRLRIVDITQRQYETANLVEEHAITSSSDSSFSYSSGEQELLGVLPVIVTPVNALYFHGIVSDDISVMLDSSGKSDSGKQFSLSIEQFTPIADAHNLSSVHMSTFSKPNIIADNFTMPLSTGCAYDESVAKIASMSFPQISFTRINQLSRKCMKHIGIAVFVVGKDKSDDGKLTFKLVESFSGSLDRTERDTNGSSLYISDIVNAQSRYINVFSNVQRDSIKDIDIALAHAQDATILGYPKAACAKTASYTKSIHKALNRIFDKLQDVNYADIDLVCDAGVTNIAQYLALHDEMSCDISHYPFLLNGSGEQQSWKLDCANDARGWRATVQKFDSLCRTMRKDCLFLADGLRTFCLEGNEKIVRSTSTGSSIDSSIVPKLRWMSGINSSYSAGYCNWFYVTDAHSGELFWCPPSIKAASACIYTDTYYNCWDAPAGLARGVVSGALDVAFSPKADQAGKMYLQSWNYAVSYPIDGIVIEGQKTFQSEATALDRINVRRLMIYFKKFVNQIARSYMYEGNTAYNRQRFVDSIRPAFEDAKNKYGINDYTILCDDTINTPEVIDRNELRCKIAIKPVKTIEWIVCDFIVTNQSSSVNEEVLN